MIENGVDWDPDADKLVAWARLLEWDEGEILRRLGRLQHAVALSPEIVEAINQAVAAGIRDGVRDVVAQLRADERAN
jgi:hypothetical protein